MRSATAQLIELHVSLHFKDVFLLANRQPVDLTRILSLKTAFILDLHPRGRLRLRILFGRAALLIRG